VAPHHMDRRPLSFRHYRCRHLPLLHYYWDDFVPGSDSCFGCYLWHQTDCCSVPMLSSSCHSQPSCCLNWLGSRRRCLHCCPGKMEALFGPRCTCCSVVKILNWLSPANSLLT
jgi:hypothetical protein